MTRITQEYVRRQVDYDPDTGEFRWRSPRFKRRIGKIAGYVATRGYRIICIDAVKYPAHRLAWLYVYGSMPRMMDHKNLVKTDNRISNLRPANSSQNSCNRRTSSSNTSGYKGVCRIDRKRNPWKAEIKHRGRKLHLGVFSSAEMAAVAYNNAATRLFGEFASLNEV